MSTHIVTNAASASSISVDASSTTPAIPQAFIPPPVVSAGGINVAAAVNLALNSAPAVAPALTAAQRQAIEELRGTVLGQLKTAYFALLEIDESSERAFANGENLATRVLRLLDQIPIDAIDEELGSIKEGANLVLSAVQKKDPTLHFFILNKLTSIGLKKLTETTDFAIKVQSEDSLTAAESLSHKVLQLLEQLPPEKLTPEHSRMKRRAANFLKKTPEIRKQKERVAIESLAELRGMVNRYDFKQRTQEISIGYKRIESLHELKQLKEEVQWYFAKTSKMCQLFDQIPASSKEEFSSLRLNGVKASLKALHQMIHTNITRLEQRERDAYAGQYATAPPAIVNVRHPDAMTEAMRISCLQEVGAHLGQYAHALQSGRPLNNSERFHAGAELDISRSLLRSLRNQAAFQHEHPEFERIQAVVDLSLNPGRSY